MAFQKIDYDGGDLGRGHICNSSDIEFLVSAVGDKLGSIDYGPYSFAIEFRRDQISLRELKIRLDKISFHFPVGVCYYEVNGEILFAVRGPSGGIVTTWIAYIIQKERKENDQKRND